MTQSNTSEAGEALAQLRHAASNLLHAVGPVDSPEAAHTLCYFAFKTGEAFHKLGQLELAEACFATATQDSTVLLQGALTSVKDADLCGSLFCSRARCAWALGQQALACNLLEKASAALARCASAAASERLAATNFDLGRSLLADDDASAAVPLLLSAVSTSTAARAQQATAGAFDARLHYKVLQCLAVAHLKAGSPELALTCARQLASDAKAGGQAAAAAAARTAPFLAVNALCGCGRLDEAEEALGEGAEGAQGAHAELVLDSCACLVKAGRPAAAAAALLTLIKAAPQRTDAALRFLELILSGDAACRQAALRLLEAPACVEALKASAAAERRGEGAGEARKKLAHALALVWNAAAALFEQKEYTAARELFSAAGAYMLPEDPNRARAARAACLCHLALREPEEASNYIALADQLEGADAGSPSVQTKFLMLKVTLEKSGDDEDALAALGGFTACADFDVDFLLLAALEAQSKQALRCAQSAFTLLFTDACAPGSASALKVQNTPGYMSQLLRHLVRVTAAKWDAADVAAQAAGSSVESGRCDELSQQFSVAAERLGALGTSCFAGDDAQTAAQELSWFALSAWNAAVASSAETQRNWGAAARLFAASGAFMDALAACGDAGAAPAPSSPSRQLAWLLSAAAQLEVHATTHGEGDLAEAQHAIARCAAASSGAPVNASTAVFVLLISFTAKARAGDDEACLELLRGAESLPGLAAETILKLAKLACSDASPAVALRAYELCLRVMQRSAGVNYADLAHVLRKTLSLAEQAGGGAAGAAGADSREARMLRMYREASALLAGVPPGLYPPEEAHWLMTSAWNRGALLVKLGRAEAAEPLLKVGLELLKHAVKHSAGLEVHKAGMLDALAALTRKRDAAPNAVMRQSTIVTD